jgi:hypothetical protein
MTPEQSEQILKNLDDFLKDLKAKWDAIAPTGSTWFSNKYLGMALQFLIEAIDESIQFVESLIEKGNDKKAAVLAILDNLYDHIAVNALPIYLKPFSGLLKQLMDLAVGALVDYIVSKYNSGSWLLEKNAKTNS